MSSPIVELYFLQNKVSKGCLCCTERLSRGAPENMFPVRTHPRNRLHFLTQQGCRTGLGTRGPHLKEWLWLSAQPSKALIPDSQEAWKDKKAVTSSRQIQPKGKHTDIQSPCGDEQQLVPHGLKLFVFLSGGPWKKSRALSSWENMLQKEN